MTSKPIKKRLQTTDLAALTTSRLKLVLKYILIVCNYYNISTLKANFACFVNMSMQNVINRVGNWHCRKYFKNVFIYNMYEILRYFVLKF